MTKEEKAKRYDEALERAKSIYKDTWNGYILEIFPELKESEDERISREITEFILTHRIDTPNDIEDTNSWLAWLEKQGQKFKYWKPSEEQLEALDYAYNLCPNTERGNYYEGVLETIIDDLHKFSEKQGE